MFLNNMEYLQSFENFLNESVGSDIRKINQEIFDNLDPFDSIAGGECHDTALIAYAYCKASGLLKNPKLLWQGNHAWVEGDYKGQDCVLDIVAVNQRHLGDAFKPVSDKSSLSYDNPQESKDAKTYIANNRHVNISAEDAEYGAKELLFLDNF